MPYALLRRGLFRLLLDHLDHRLQRLSLAAGSKLATSAPSASPTRSTASIGSIFPGIDQIGDQSVEDAMQALGVVAALAQQLAIDPQRDRFACY
jgi:hypothetical protein